MHNNYSSRLPFLDFTNKRIFLRADLNVPIIHNTITHTHRLTALLPTLNYILARKGRIILVTHIGRPQTPDPALSTRILVPWFTQAGYSIVYAPTLEEAQQLLATSEYQIVVLENIRFWPQEKAGDLAFAQALKNLADIYITEAFASLHRTDTSITLLPELFSCEHRTFGFLVEQELRALSKMRDNPEQPFTLIMGGGKVTDKLPLLEALIDKVTTILLCPALVFTFLKARQQPVGISLVDTTQIQQARAILDRAQARRVTVLFPTDYLIARDTFTGPLALVSAAAFPDNGVGISIGPNTIKQFEPYILTAKTIFFNALMGSLERPDTLEGVKKLLLTIKQSPGYSVIGGGESVAAAYLFGVAPYVSYCSTGGGATLTFLSGNPLAGLMSVACTDPL